MPKRSKREGPRRAGCCLAPVISRVCRSYPPLVLFPRSYPGRNLIRLPFESSRLEPNWIEWLVAAGARISRGEWKDTLAKYLTSLSENSEPCWKIQKKRAKEERKEDTVLPPINFPSVPRIDRGSSKRMKMNTLGSVRNTRKVFPTIKLIWIIINFILHKNRHTLYDYKVIIYV